MYAGSQSFCAKSVTPFGMRFGTIRYPQDTEQEIRRTCPPSNELHRSTRQFSINHQFVDAVEGQRNCFCRHRATRRRMQRELPDGVVSLMSFRARFSARPASVGIRFGLALLRQISRRRNSLRTNRPELDSHSFSLHCGDIDRPRKQHFVHCSDRHD